MQKIIFKNFLVFVLLTNILLKSTFEENGYPVIFHYDPDTDKVMLALAREMSPQFVVNVIPNLLVQEILKQLRKNVQSPKSEFLKIIESKSIKVIFDIVVWAKVVPQWPDDRQYNVVFHEFAKNWIAEITTKKKMSKENFSGNMLIGLFDPNGVKEIAIKNKVEEIYKPISLDRFAFRNIHHHDKAYSPNNSAFVLNGSREIATFWTAAISPKKKNLVIIFNILIDNKELSDKARSVSPPPPSPHDPTKPLLKIADFKPILEVLNDNASVLKNKEDVIALRNGIALIRQAHFVPNVFASIFQDGGYRDQIIRYKDIMNIAKGAKTPQDIMNNVDQTSRILTNIEWNGRKQISNSTPLRNFLAKHGFLPDKLPIILDKQKAFVAFEQTIEEKRKAIKKLLSA